MKASVNSAFPFGRAVLEDPKLGELTMARVNPEETWEEARTRAPCNTLG